MTTTPEAGVNTTPATGRRVTPTGRLILPATADRTSKEVASNGLR